MVPSVAGSVFLVACAVFVTQLSYPPAVIFDEAHYVQWSREISQGRLVQDNPDNPAPFNGEHPPLAKFLMAGSLRLFHAGQPSLTWDQYFKGCVKAESPCPASTTWEGCDHPNSACSREAFAWRFPSALTGAGGVAALFVLARRLFQSMAAGLFAASLLLLDNLWYLQSRLAMLDVFAAAFGVAALALAWTPSRPSRVASGVAMGLALATKFSALFLLPFFVLAHLLRTRPGPWARRLLVALTLGTLLPLATLLATYLPYLQIWTSQRGLTFAFTQLFVTQGSAVAWDFGAEFTHPFVTRPWAWILHLRPTFLYWPNLDHYGPPLMYTVGNVALWWSASAALVAVPVWGARRWLHSAPSMAALWDRVRAVRFASYVDAPARGIGLATLLFWSAFLPWWILPRPTFQYYATLNVPYFSLVLGGLLGALWAAGPRLRALAVAHLGFVGLWSLLWWPIVSGARVPDAYFDTIWNLLPWMGR